MPVKKSCVILSLLAAWFVASTVHAQSQEAGTEAPEAQGQSPRFDIWEFNVEGNTLLDTKMVERAVYQYLGPAKTINDVELARKHLEELYHSQGFGTVQVDIPEQNVDNGLVRLRVTEGKVDRLRITGSRYYSLGYIRSRVPALAKGNVPYLPDVQAQLGTLNQETQDRKITPVMRPGRTPGSVEIELKVEDEFPLHGSVELNNRYSPDTSTLRLVNNLRYDNLWQRGHSLGLSYLVAPEDPDEVAVFSGTYVMRWPHESNRVLALYALSSDSDVATAGTIAVIGKGTIVGARYIMPLQSLHNYFHNVKLGIDYKDFKEDTFPIGGPTNKTPITYLHWSTEYELNYLTDSSTTRFSIGPQFGLRGVVNDQKDFALKRTQADANYFYLASELNFDYRWPSRVAASVRLDGQWAASPLISNEQYSAGGLESVRGYQESEFLGDDGMRLSLELRSPSYASLIPVDAIDEFYFLAFTDAAKVWFDDATGGQEKSSELIGAGFGMRVGAGKYIGAALDLAWPLKDGEESEQGEIRPHFSVELGF